MDEFIEKFLGLAESLREHYTEKVLIDEFVDRIASSQARMIVGAAKPDTLKQAVRVARDATRQERYADDSDRDRRSDRRKWRPREGGSPRRSKPIRDADGKMRCHSCGSEKHLIRECPARDKQPQKKDSKAKRGLNHVSSRSRCAKDCTEGSSEEASVSDSSGNAKDL
jgi:hypothetical protein